MPPPVAEIISPARRIAGRIRVPGDKSISHRYAMLAALAEGRSTLSGFAPGADCRSTLSCLRQLGVRIIEGPDAGVEIIGLGTGRLKQAAGPLDAGNSGTTMRLMAGIAAGHPFATGFIGDESLSRRPMRRVITPLEEMGARIDSTDGHAPLTVHGGRIHPIVYRPEVPSAQVKSAVLLAGLHADGITAVHEPAPTRDHTERALVAFGGTVAIEGTRVSVPGGQQLTARDLSVPGDFSSAAFWLVAAAAAPGASVEIERVGLNPTRTGLLDVLRRFGARVTVTTTTEDAGEPQGTIRVEHAETRTVDVTADEVPGLIDELPAIAALAAAGGQITVSGAAELRVKESDRIATLVAGFRALGFSAIERPDGFVISGAGGERASGGVAEARGDHRMAMAFAIAALAGDRPSTISGADSVVISYPGFFDTLKQLTA